MSYERKSWICKNGHDLRVGGVDSQSRCKVCTKARQQRYHKTHRYRSVSRHLRKAYGISVAQRDQMLVSQNYACAICGVTEGEGRLRLHIDHDHETGKIRGLLCKICNMHLLPSVERRLDVVFKAIDYLEKGGVM